MRFFSQQIVNSSAYRRNMAVQDTIEKDLDTALKYQTATGHTKDVKISEQILAIWEQSKCFNYLKSNSTIIYFVFLI